MNLQVFIHCKMTFRNYFCSNKTKHSRMMHVQYIKLEVFTCHILQKINWKIRKSTTPYLLYFFFPFHLSKSNEISDLEESLSTIACNCLCPEVKVVNDKSNQNYWVKGSLVENDLNPSLAYLRLLFFMFPDWPSSHPNHQQPEEEAEVFGRSHNIKNFMMQIFGSKI